MHVHVLQHVPFEGPGYLEQWCDRQGARVSFTRFYETAWQLPPPSAPDLVLIMGGPMSVHDGAHLPWLAAEKRFVAQRVRQDLATLGICLGAQLIAWALGARVYPGPFAEIGWFEVYGIDGQGFRFPPRFWALHWHGETFDLPVGATWLARSAACKHQAFQVGRRVVGLQFHLETTPELLRGLLEHSAADLKRSSPYVQTHEQILAVPQQRYDELHELMDQLLEYLLE